MVTSWATGDPVAPPACTEVSAPLIDEFRSHLKKVFSLDIGVDASIQILDIREYACGLNLSLALISSENPNFEIASINESPTNRLGYRNLLKLYDII